ncbi:hypothetical protein TWF694_002941 [Orbilia ellipsospora]|uniref:Uncharacterized protein n=1 Tax=Orbilia ellipsospora TaxID=2528407 RepID=A0AAV9X055_9PEZI
MHHSVLLSITPLFLLALVSALPAPVPPRYNTPPINNNPSVNGGIPQSIDIFPSTTTLNSTNNYNPNPQQLHDVVEDMMCEDDETGVTTYYETHDLDLQNEENAPEWQYYSGSGNALDDYDTDDDYEDIWNSDDDEDVDMLYENEGISIPRRRLKKRDIIPPPASSSAVKRLKKRGNMCFKTSAEYYTDPSTNTANELITNTNTRSTINPGLPPHYVSNTVPINISPDLNRRNGDLRSALAELEAEEEEITSRLAAERSETLNYDGMQRGYSPRRAVDWSDFEFNFGESGGGVEDLVGDGELRDEGGLGVGVVPAGLVGGGGVAGRGRLGEGRDSRLNDDVRTIVFHVEDGDTRTDIADTDIQGIDMNVIPPYLLSSGQRFGLANGDVNAVDSDLTHSIIDEDRVRALSNARREDLEGDYEYVIEDGLEQRYQRMLDGMVEGAGLEGSFDGSEFPNLEVDTMRMIGDFNSEAIHGGGRN